MVSHCGLELEAVPPNTEKRSVYKDQSRKGTACFLVKLVSRETCHLVTYSSLLLTIAITLIN